MDVMAKKIKNGGDEQTGCLDTDFLYVTLKDGSRFMMIERDGKLEVSVDHLLVVLPRAANSIHLSIKGHWEK